MANHVRRQIREAVGTAVTGLTTTGSRVFQSRVYPLETTDLPGLLINTQSEQSEPISIHGPRMLQRTVQLNVVAVARAVADLDDTLDGICKEVEIALASAGSLGGLAKSVTLASTELEMSGEVEKPTGRAQMTFEVEYFVLENAPDVAQ